MIVAADRLLFACSILSLLILCQVLSPANHSRTIVGQSLANKETFLGGMTIFGILLLQFNPKVATCMYSYFVHLPSSESVNMKLLVINIIIKVEEVMYYDVLALETHFPPLVLTNKQNYAYSYTAMFSLLLYLSMHILI